MVFDGQEGDFCGRLGDRYIADDFLVHGMVLCSKYVSSHMARGL